MRNAWSRIPVFFVAKAVKTAGVTWPSTLW
jgi:hypothetical protein